MPYKFNEPRRDKIPKVKYKLDNWREYDEALRRRGDLTVWITPEAIEAWHPPKVDGKRGRQPYYSDIAMETGLMLRLAFKRPWRQTQGTLRSVLRRLALDLDTPVHTTFSRRSLSLPIGKTLTETRGPVHVVIDSTGLKVYGAGQWQAGKHGVKPRRTWRKLHVGVDPDSGEILACELTPKEVDDCSPVGPLLDQVAGEITAVTADGAYDGDPTSRTVAERAPAATVIIPPRSTAVPSATAATAPTQRDRHLATTAKRGRLGWQRVCNYGRRSLAETTMYRYKVLIGRSLHARSLPAQKVEARVACQVLNRMTRLGMLASRRVA